VRDAIYAACQLLAENPGIGHTREDLTDRPVNFWSVFSYLVVYNPASFPLKTISEARGSRRQRSSAQCRVAGCATTTIKRYRPEQGTHEVIARRNGGASRKRQGGPAS
jgi:hypothetical protein